MSELVIDFDYLRRIDEHFKADDFEKCEAEIEIIVANLWEGTGKYKQLIQPLFTTYLQTELLRSLYIHYFSITELARQYDRISVHDSNVIVDVIANYLGLDLIENRQNWDEELSLVRDYTFIDQNNKDLRRWARRSYHYLKCFLSTISGIDVLYLNAGKLEKDFKKIKKSLNARFIPIKPSDRFGLETDIEELIQRSISNLRNLQISVPIELVIDLLHKRVFNCLLYALNQIFSYANFIERNKVKLIILSTPTHEEHLCLLSSTKLVECSSLIIPHGQVGSVNRMLDGYITYQGTINGFEYQYAGSRQMKLKMAWFDEYGI